MRQNGSPPAPDVIVPDETLFAAPPEPQPLPPLAVFAVDAAADPAPAPEAPNAPGFVLVTAVEAVAADAPVPPLSKVLPLLLKSYDAPVPAHIPTLAAVPESTPIDPASNPSV